KRIFMQSRVSATTARSGNPRPAGQTVSKPGRTSSYTGRPNHSAERSPSSGGSSASRPSVKQSFESSKPSRSPDSRTRGARTQSNPRNSPRQGRGAPSGGKGNRVKQFIDPERFICEARQIERDVYVPENRFQDFKVQPRIIGNLLDKGYETPTPIQDQTIKHVLDGRDVVGIANTGTGKTAAFAVPLIHDLITHMENRVIVLAPTRELAQQIVEEFMSFSKGCSLRTALLIGGASMHLQKRDLRYNPRIVVGTPGRIKDHLSQGTLDLSFFNRVVLDEVDRMLDMGFIKDISAILSRVKPVRQSLFFSATMEGETASLIKKFSKDPVTVSTRVGETAENVTQDVVWYRDNGNKIEKLHDVLISSGCQKTIIFDDTKRLVEKLAKDLLERGFKVDRIHGDKSQAQRTRAIKRLKTDEINILVATDVAARGLDVSDITHVINYSQPNTYDDYVHRIGRTGRAGKTGKALTFLQK
ncbi:MAG TPA: DEAD/DEAH box helicase, partial [Treponemataceae bacterium]|nr:DEAD/DEAH box helicase [Treponemataceae bacterium]